MQLIVEFEYDLYAYTSEAVAVEVRAKLLKPRAARLELHNTFVECSYELVEPDGIPCDLMYRLCDAIGADVEAKLGRGLASLAPRYVSRDFGCGRNAD